MRLEEIIAPSERRNERNHITGKLLFTGTHFLGILEGQESDLRNLWLRLEKDTRHGDLIRIGDVLCGQRWFPEWEMGFTKCSDVGVTIESLRSMRARAEIECDVACPQVEALRSPPTEPMPAWAQIVRPIMCAPAVFRHDMLSSSRP